MLTGNRQLASRFRWLNLLVAVLLTMPAMLLADQTLEIKLVDGRNGRPMVGTSAYVNVWVGGERKEAIAIPTDDHGVARLQLTLNPNDENVAISTGRGTMVEKHPVVRYEESFRINAPYVLCGAEGNRSWLDLKNFSTKEVLDHGYASGTHAVKLQPHHSPDKWFCSSDRSRSWRR